MRTDFSELALPETVLALYLPSSDALRERLRPFVTVEILRSISGYEPEDYFNELLAYRDGKEPDPEGWVPGYLGYYLVGTDPYTLLFCGALLLDFREKCPDRYMSEISYTPMLGAAIKLGDEWAHLAAQLHTYQLTTWQPWDEYYLTAAFALFLLNLSIKSAESRRVVPLLLEWLRKSDQEIRPWHANNFGGFHPYKDFQKKIPKAASLLTDLGCSSDALDWLVI